jgi:hypothetical protein
MKTVSVLQRSLSVHFKSLQCGLLCAIIACLICGLPLAAQIGGEGSITGTVTDPTGAVIPNASVTAINNATNVKTAQTTSSSGVFTLSPLDPGTYTVTFSAPGFKTLTQDNISVDALQVVGLKPQLTVGSTSETVTVASAPPQLDTTNAVVGATMENQEYTSLPLVINGSARNPTDARSSARWLRRANRDIRWHWQLRTSRRSLY